MVSFARPQQPHNPNQWTLPDILKRSSEILYPLLVENLVPNMFATLDLEFHIQAGVLNHIRVGDEDLLPLVSDDDCDGDCGCGDGECDLGGAIVTDQFDASGDPADGEGDGAAPKVSSVIDTLRVAMASLRLKLEACMSRDFFGSVKLSVEVEDGVCEMIRCKSERIHKIASAKIPQ